MSNPRKSLKTRRSRAAQGPGFNDQESPLYRLFSRRDSSGRAVINEFQFAAGERLRIDYERANLERRITSSWSGTGGGAPAFGAMSDNHIANLCDAAIDARRRVHAAFDAVGPELAGVLYYVCCLAAGLEQAERRLDYPQRSGKAILAMALTRLARHYRLLRAPERSDLAPSVDHWALADYRPRIMPPARQP